MLLIWDLHLSTNYWEKIIKQLENIFDTNPDEKNIVFLWDFVYHFSYDRKSLLDLYTIFIKLFEKNKNIYILAGNHDWLWQHFVYQEAQKAFEIINSITNQNRWKLFFITEPLLTTIENEEFLFLPFMINPNETELKTSNYQIQNTIQELDFSKNNSEKQSAKINTILANFIEQNKKLTVIHHYYFNKTQFPGQKSIFSFKDIALSEIFLENPNIKFISGHLHQSFIYKNYFCLWSFWSTSPLEINHNKFFAKYQTNSQKIELYEVTINPYLQIKQDFISENSIQEFLQSLQENSKRNCVSNNFWNTEFYFDENENLKNTTLTILVSDLNYDKLNEYIPESLKNTLNKVKLKKETINQEQLLQDFELQNKNLSETISDRKTLLKVHLQNQFQEDYDKYIAKLQELKVL